MFQLLFRTPLMNRKPETSFSSLHLHGVSLLSVLLKTSHRQYHHDLKINVNSTEMIKPSSPTPSSLTAFKLSLIDNHCAPIYVPFVFFYPAPGHTGSEPTATVEVLKSSLAKTLTRFYPLAGRLSKSSSSTPIVRCNDEGVPFTSAAVVVDGDDHSSTMAQFLSKQPEIDSLHRFLPFPADLISTPSGLESAPQIAFKATAFPCGGLALGVCVFHKIIDGCTLADFMKLWAAVARSGGDDGRVEGYAHNRAATTLLPARHDDGGVVDVAAAEEFVNAQGKIATRRLVFDEEAVRTLKARAKSDRVPNPTRTEAVSGFLWKSAVSATARGLLSPDGGAKQPSILSVAGMAVNLRSRLNEPWPDYSVGNILWTALSFYDHNQQQQQQQGQFVDETTSTLQAMVGKLRESTAKIDKHFMAKLQGAEGREMFLRNQEMLLKSATMTGGVDNGSTVVMPFTVTSTIGLRLYDVDFGWGKPTWISMTTYSYAVKNMAVLMESPIGYGVEAWLTMDQQEMTILENEPEFLTYAKNNTPVI